MRWYQCILKGGNVRLENGLRPTAATAVAAQKSTVKTVYGKKSETRVKDKAG